MQIKTTTTDYFTSTRMVIIKQMDNNACQQGCGVIETLTYCWWNVKQCSYFGKKSGCSSKISTQNKKQGYIVQHRELQLLSRNNFFLKINLFIIYFYFWLHWVFVAVHGLSLVAASGGYSFWWFLLLRSVGSRCAGFSSCGS